MIRVIACDLDGTLLDSNSEIHQRSAHLLHHLWQKGMVVVLATGRSWRTALSVQSRIGISGPLVAHNGAYVFDSAEGQEWHRRPLDLEDARQMLDYADAHEIMMRGYLGSGWPVVFNRFTPDHELLWRQPEDRCIHPAGRNLRRAPIELFFFGDQEVEPFVSQFGRLTARHELGVFPRPHIRAVNICAPGVDKVEALEVIVQRMGLGRENVLALGDGPNDVRMLEWAGTAVAMAGAVREAKAVADYVSQGGAVEGVEDGLRWALRQSEGIRTARPDVPLL